MVRQRRAALGAVAMSAALTFLARPVAPAAHAADAMPVLGVIGGTPATTAVSGNLAVVGMGMTVSIVDVSTSSYREIGRSRALPGTVRHLAYDGRRAVALLERGAEGVVTVIDPARPSSPVLGSTTVVDRCGQGIRPEVCDVGWMDAVLDGNRLYVARRSRGLAVVDVADPRAPRVSGAREDGLDWWSVVADDDVLYALTRDALSARLLVVDVGDPARPRIAGAIALPGDPVDLVRVGNAVVALTAGSASREPAVLSVIDVARPELPALTAQLDTRFGSGAEITAHDARIWIGGWIPGEPGHYEVDAFDVRDPSAPARIGGAWQLPGSFADLQAVGDRLFFVATFALHGWDTSGPRAPTPAGVTPGYPWYGAAVASGETVWAIHGTATAFDMRDPAHPAPVVEVPDFAEVARLLVLSQTRILVAGRTTSTPSDPCTLATIDVSSPSPTVLATHAARSACADLAVYGSRAYLAVADRVVIADIDPSGAIAARGEITFSQRVRHVSASARYAWVVSGEGGWPGQRWLDAFAITSAASPRRVGRVAIKATVPPAVQGPSEVLAQGPYAWVADADRVRVLEIDDGETVVEHPSLPAMTDADCLARDGGILFVFGHPFETTWSIVVADISDPRHPRRITELDRFAFAALDTRTEVLGISAAPGRLVLAGYADGIVVLDSRRAARLPSPTPTATWPSPTPDPTRMPTTAAPVTATVTGTAGWTASPTPTRTALASPTRTTPPTPQPSETPTHTFTPDRRDRVAFLPRAGR